MAVIADLADEAEGATGQPLGHGEAPLTCRIAMVITASLTVFLFIHPDVVFDLVEMLVQTGS